MTPPFVPGIHIIKGDGTEVANSPSRYLWIVSCMEDAIMAFSYGSPTVICVDVPRARLCSHLEEAAAFYNSPAAAVEPRHPFPQGASVRAIRNIVRGTVPGGSVVVGKGALGIINAIMSVGILDAQGYDVSFDSGLRIFVLRDEVELSCTQERGGR